MLSISSLRIIRHPRYNSYNIDNNIVLIKNRFHISMFKWLCRAVCKMPNIFIAWKRTDIETKKTF